MKKIILDTDIGTDVDDSIALMYCLNNPEIELLSITTVHGNAQLRAKIAKKFIGKRNIPVAAGLDKPLVKKEIYWMGHEGKGVLDGTEQEPEQNAVELLYKTISKNKDVSLVCIGPLTNIAALLQQKPEVKRQIKEIYFMGSAVEKNGLFIPNYEKHNIKVDPEAADVIFNSGIELKIITTELSKGIYTAKKEFEELRDKRKPFTEYLYQNAMQYMAARKQEVCYLYDPLTVLAVTEPGLIKFETKGKISVSQSTDLQGCKNKILEMILATALLTNKSRYRAVGEK
jgi:purine nucleosidase